MKAKVVINLFLETPRKPETPSSINNFHLIHLGLFLNWILVERHNCLLLSFCESHWRFWENTLLLPPADSILRRPIPGMLPGQPHFSESPEDPVYLSCTWPPRASFTMDAPLVFFLPRRGGECVETHVRCFSLLNTPFLVTPAKNVIHLRLFPPPKIPN